MINKTEIEIFTGTKKELDGLFSEDEAVIIARLLKGCVNGNNELKHQKSLILFWLQKECYEAGKIDSICNSDEYRQELGEIISKVYKLSVFQCNIVFNIIKEYWNEPDEIICFNILSRLTNGNKIILQSKYTEERVMKKKIC